MLMIYVWYMVCRLVFLWSNWESYAAGFDKLELNQLITGSLYTIRSENLGSVWQSGCLS